MRTNFTSCVLGLSAILLVSQATSAYAECSPDQRQNMLKMSEDGDRLFGEQKYAEAAQAFFKANRECASPILAKNTTIAWYKADRCDKAIQTGIGYIMLGEWPSNPEDGDLQDYRDGKTILVRCNLQLAKTALKKDDLDAAKRHLEAVDEQIAPENQRPKYSFIFSGDDQKTLKEVREEYDTLLEKKNNPDKGKELPKITPPPKADPPILAYSLIGAGAVGGVVALSRYGYHLFAVDPGIHDTFDKCVAGVKMEHPNEGMMQTDALKVCEAEGIAETKAENDTMRFVFAPIGVASAALIGVGVYMLMAPTEKAPTESSVRLLPVVGPTQTGVQLHWTF